MSELTDKLDFLRSELEVVKYKIFLAIGLEQEKKRLEKEIADIEKQIKETPVKFYNFVIEELQIHYSNEKVNLIMSYGPFEYVKDEYFNNGFGDNGYDVYLKVPDGMKDDKNLFGFFESYFRDGMLKVSEYLLEGYKYRQTYD